MVKQTDVAANYYDYTRGWDHTNVGWHEIVLNISYAKHLEIIVWIYEKLDKPERHSRWIRFSDGSGFKFRYERDFILFTLSWS